MDKVDREARQKAKAVNFGFLGAVSLSQLADKYLKDGEEILKKQVEERLKKENQLFWDFVDTGNIKED